MTGYSEVHEGVKAYVSEASDALSLNIAIARVRVRDVKDYEVGPPFLFFPPTHVLHMGAPGNHAGSWTGTRYWQEIEDPATAQEPTLLLQHEEAAALMEALIDHFNFDLPQPVIVSVRNELTEEELEKLRQNFLDAYRKGKVTWR